MREAKRRRRKMGWLTFAEAAVETCFTKASLKAMAKAGDLKSLRVGRRWFVAISEVERLKAA
jgi:hypothetical protein